MRRFQGCVAMTFREEIMRSIFLFLLLLFLASLGTAHGADENMAEELKKNLPVKAEYDELRNERVKSALKSFSEKIIKNKEKGGTRQQEREGGAQIYFFDIGSDYETAKEAMESKGFEFSELDKEKLKGQQRIRMTRKGIPPEEMKFYKPLEMPDYRRSTAVKDGILYILSSHFFDPETKQWELETNLQVIRLGTGGSFVATPKPPASSQKQDQIKGSK